MGLNNSVETCVDHHLDICHKVEQLSKLDEKDKAVCPVTVNVYHLGHKQSIQRVNQVFHSFLHTGGVFHAAVEVYGVEWSFGFTRRGSGIFSCDPKKCPMHTFTESVYLGDANKLPGEVQFILQRMEPNWAGMTYDILKKNCCNFSDEFVKQLGFSGGIPKWIHRAADIGATLNDDFHAAKATFKHELDELHEVSESLRGHKSQAYADLQVHLKNPSLANPSTANGAANPSTANGAARP